MELVGEMLIVRQQTVVVKSALQQEQGFILE
jgi:hypothetical protein